MNKLNLLTTALIVALGVGAPAAFAQSTNQQPGAANETMRDSSQPATGPAAGHADLERDIEDEDFIEEASAKGMAEIETANMALENGTDAVKDFAQRMIEDHGKANKKMQELAQKHDLDISDEATLMDKAKAMTLQVRDGESFDEAYANNQVNAHEQTIELFQRASNSDNADISAFAKQTLPKLEQHLDMARELAEETGAAND